MDARDNPRIKSWIKSGDGHDKSNIMTVGITRNGPIDNNSVELRLHGGGDDRLPRQFLRRFIPRLFFYNAALNCLRQQLSDFIAFQGNELIIGVELIELGTKIQGMNAWIISFQTRKCFDRRKKLYFFTIFLSNVAMATRSFSVEGPTMVPASNMMIQSFFVTLSAWIGM